MTFLKAISALCFGVAFVAADAPEVAAADLGVTTVKKVRVVRHGRARVVRDYDGTAVVERRIRLVERLPDGTLARVWHTEMIASERATPRTYLNGQPVLPHGARSPLRVVVMRYR